MRFLNILKNQRFLERERFPHLSVISFQWTSNKIFASTCLVLKDFASNYPLKINNMYDLSVSNLLHDIVTKRTCKRASTTCRIWGVTCTLPSCTYSYRFCWTCNSSAQVGRISHASHPILVLLTSWSKCISLLLPSEQGWREDRYFSVCLLQWRGVCMQIIRGECDLRNWNWYHFSGDIAALSRILSWPL